MLSRKKRLHAKTISLYICMNIQYRQSLPYRVDPPSMVKIVYNIIGVYTGFIRGYYSHVKRGRRTL